MLMTRNWMLIVFSTVCLTMLWMMREMEKLDADDEELDNDGVLREVLNDVMNDKPDDVMDDARDEHEADEMLDDVVVKETLDADD